MKQTIRKFNFKAGLPQEFEILDLSVLYSKSKNIITHLHRAGFYHIIWFQDCKVSHLVDFKEVKIKHGSLLFINKDIVHRFDNKEKVKGKVLLFTDAFFCRTDNDTRFLNQTPLFNDLFDISLLDISKQEVPFNSLLQLMQAELGKGADEYQANILQKLLSGFLLLAERERQKQFKRVQRKGADLEYAILFNQLVGNGFRTHKQVSYYAGKISITEKRLNQATKKIFGKTPKELIDDRILLEAKRMLAHDAETVKEIGYYLGFEEPTNFIKYFRKKTSLTPVAFKEKYKLD